MFYVLWINNHNFKNIKRFYITFVGIKTSQIITDTALHINIPSSICIRVGRIYIQ